MVYESSVAVLIGPASFYKALVFRRLFLVAFDVPYFIDTRR